MTKTDATRPTVTCPHCGDVTEQSFMLPEFTCGACDGSFRPASQTTDRMRSAEQIALEMSEELRRRFGHDMRHTAGRAWLAACIMEARHEMALELGLSNRPRPGPNDLWRLKRDA